MAGKSAAELEKELADLKQELAANKKALSDAKETKIVSPPVPGTFTVEGKGADGKPVKQKFKFKNGRTSTPLKFAENIGFTVPSAMLIALANGKKRADIEGIDKVEALEKVDQTAAQVELEYLVEINASTIEQVK